MIKKFRQKQTVTAIQWEADEHYPLNLKEIVNFCDPKVISLCVRDMSLTLHFEEQRPMTMFAKDWLVKESSGFLVCTDMLASYVAEE